VKNEPDSSVTVEAGGEDDRINEFIGWCLRGPDGAVVDHIDVQETQFPETGSFVIEE
jgi:acylphosphatase